jgi:hypothetical protein
MAHINDVRDCALLDRGKALHKAKFDECVIQTGEKNNKYLPCGGACKVITILEDKSNPDGPKDYRVRCHHHGKDLTPAETKGCTKKVIPKIKVH